MAWGSVFCRPFIKRYKQRMIDLISFPPTFLCSLHLKVNIKFMYTLLLEYYLMRTIIIIVNHNDNNYCCL